MKHITRLATLALAALLGACGYFNSLYNAERRFAEAQRAEQRGEAAIAAGAYSEAVERAAVSYRKYPDGRWADDALLLIGRARFALGQYPAARAALARVLEQSRDRALRAEAAMYLGASLVELQRPDSALLPLDQALGAFDEDSRQHAFARVWRGRALLLLARPEGWQDLERAAARNDAIGLQAALELATRGLSLEDSTRTLTALGALVGGETAGARADTVLALLGRASRAFGPRAVLLAVPERAGARWQPEPRTRLRHERARLLAIAGDTAAAVRAAVAAAQESNAQAAARARRTAAAWVVQQADSVTELGRARAILLPAIGDPDVLRDIRRLRTIEELLGQAEVGQTAALFAAAELVRDSLASPGLARRLFLTYADAMAASVWAPKALLAALALSAGEQRAPIEARLREVQENVYVAALYGHADAAAYQIAEERLGRAVTAARLNAGARAETGDVSVTRAATVLDSLRSLARADSLVQRCGALLDSLALRGVRADSVRGACVRADTALVTRYLAMDTLQLRGAADSTRRRRVVPDTLTP